MILWFKEDSPALIFKGSGCHLCYNYVILSSIDWQMLLPAAISYQRKERVIFPQRFMGSKHQLLFQLLKAHFAKFVTLVTWFGKMDQIMIFFF